MKVKIITIGPNGITEGKEKAPKHIVKQIKAIRKSMRHIEKEKEIDWKNMLKNNTQPAVQPSHPFELRFTPTGYWDPNGTLIRLDGYYDRLLNMNLSIKEAQKLCERSIEIAKDNGINYQSITSQELDSIIQSIYQADKINEAEQYRRDFNIPSTDVVDVLRDAIKGVKVKQAKNKNKQNKRSKIVLTTIELQSNHNRVQWAEDLIVQLPNNHEGRNSWLLNYGQGPEAQQFRNKHQILFDSKTQSAVDRVV